MTDEQIKANKNARECGEAVFDLIRQESELVPDDARIHYWRAIAHAIGPKLLEGFVDTRVLPVTNEWAKEYEIERLKYGSHAGQMIGDVAVEDPEYLDWLLRSSEEMAANLSRYLRSDRGRARLARTAVPG